MDSIARSPSRCAHPEGTSTQKPDTGSESEGSTDSKPSKKRKAANSPLELSPAQLEPSSQLTKMKRRILALIDIGKKYHNVHKEIKKIASELDSMVNRCIADSKRENMERATLEKEYSRLKEQEKRPASTHAACQTEGGSGEARFDISGRRFDKFEDVLPVLDIPWGEKCYEFTKFMRGDLLKEDFTNLMFFAEPDKTKQTRDAKRILDRYPELALSEEVECEGGKYTGVEQIVRFSVAGAELRGKSRNIMCMRPNWASTEDDYLKTLYNSLKEIANVVEKTEEKEAIIVSPQGLEMGKMRKLMEIVFRSMGIQARISAGKESPDAETKKKAKGVAIVVEGNGATYADTLRES